MIKINCIISQLKETYLIKVNTIGCLFESPIGRNLVCISSKPLPSMALG